jgi:polar amino acid transport system substrate-binding protein
MLKPLIRFFFFLLALLFSCTSPASTRLKIGVDPNWYPLDFGAQKAYVNGFIEEMLIGISRYNRVEFELIETNWDSLLDGLKQKKYDFIISSMAPLPFSLPHYDFSENFFPLGPVLVLPKSSSSTRWDHLEGELVGCVAGDPFMLEFQKKTSVFLRIYPTTPELLNAVLAQEVKGALIDRMEALSYLTHLYQGQFTIVDGLSTQQGLYLISLKDQHPKQLKIFNQTLDALKKKKKIEVMMQKWHLSI